MLEAASRVGVDASVLLRFPGKVVSEKRTRAENLLASHNGDMLASEKLSSNNTGEATEEMATAVNDNFLFEHA